MRRPGQGKQSPFKALEGSGKEGESCLGHPSPIFCPTILKGINEEVVHALEIGAYSRPTEEEQSLSESMDVFCVGSQLRLPCFERSVATISRLDEDFGWRLSWSIPQWGRNARIIVTLKAKTKSQIYLSLIKIFWLIFVVNDMII